MIRLHCSCLPPTGDGSDFEIVERKGRGHPDSLADGLAEAVSAAYSRYTLKLCGHVLHHNVDKTALLGGAACVHFGGGAISSPIEALVNGRFSGCLGGVELPVVDLAQAAATAFLSERLPLLDVNRHVRVRVRSSQAASPGAVGDSGDSPRARWFSPRSIEDLRDAGNPLANDTSVGVGFAPLSSVERLTLRLEEAVEGLSRANGEVFGSDTKVMICRSGSDALVTLAVPQLACATASLHEYVERRTHAAAHLEMLIRDIEPGLKASVVINARDDDETPELYLTLTGSSLESGDEGVVGRGNRANGLITPCRPMSLEGVAGKNPVYHVGKLYNIMAGQVAERLHSITGRATSVWLVSRTGADLLEPQFCAVGQEGESPAAGLVHTVLGEVGAALGQTRDDLICGELSVTP
jgi:S-adenosylmethionine synthetase